MGISGDYITCKGKNKRGNWCHRLRWRPYQGAKQREKNFTAPTKKASKDAAEDYRIRLRRGEIGAGSISFESLVTSWREERVDRCKLNTLTSYDRTVRNHLKPAFGDRRDAASITPSDVQQLNQKLIAAGKSQHVRTQVLGTLRAIFRHGIKLNELIFDPTAGIPKPGAVPRDVYILTSAQQQSLLDAASCAQMRLLFALAMYCGLRQGELLGLKWSAIEFQRGGLIIVREQWSSGEWTSPKSGKSREVAFDDRIAGWLRDWRLQCPSDTLLFPSSKGTPIDAKNMMNREYRPALVRSGIAGELNAADRPRYRFHDLRHCFASLLLAAGASIYDVQRAMGHASIRTTEELYGHLVPGFHDEIRRKQAQITENVRIDDRPTLRIVS